MGDTTKVEEAPKLPRPVIDADECKSCGRCVEACPKKCLKMGSVLNNRGVYPVTYQGEGCIGCAMCFYNCPEPYALKVQKA